MRSLRTKATDITPKVREKVKARDKNKCVYCGFGYAINLAHIWVNRSHGGLGIEQNLVCLCLECHTKLDNGKEIHAKPIREHCERYLKAHYKIDVEKMRYKKYENIGD